MTAEVSRVGGDWTRLERFVAGPRAPVAAAVVGAVPTLIHMGLGASFLVDDWTFLDTARSEGLGGFATGIDVRSRPFQAAYHGVTFVVFDDSVWAHLLLLAALNALVGALAVLAARTVLSPRLTVLAVAVFLVLANRGATRLWIAAAPIVVAMALTLLAAWLALRTEARPVLATMCVVLATVTYESGFFLGCAVVVIAWLRMERPNRERLFLGSLCLAVVAAVGAWGRATSPKSGDASGVPDLRRVIETSMGTALLPDALLALAPLVVLAVLVAAVVAVMPAWRRRDSIVLVGAGVGGLLLTVGPFAAAGFPLSTDGMLDRANAFTTIPVSLLIANALDQLWRIRASVAIAVSTATIAVLAFANIHDVQDARRAGEEGKEVLAAIDALAPQIRADGPAKLSPLPGRGGWAAFGYGSVGSAVFITSGERLPIGDSVDWPEFERSDAPLKLEVNASIAIRISPGS